MIFGNIQWQKLCLLQNHNAYIFILSQYKLINQKKCLQYFHNIREMEWAIDLALRYNKPVAATMCIGEILLCQ